METKINIVELLKDCPQGMELDCPIYENLYFDCICEHKIYPIVCYTIDSKGEKNKTSFNWYGKHTPVDTAKCVIFPKGKTTWEGFVPPCKFKDGDIVSCTMYPEGTWIGIFKQYGVNTFESHCSLNTSREFRNVGLKNHSCRGIHLATEEEKQQLFDAIKANGYKWDAETKTLEKLVEPKFKVGDKVRYKNNHNVIFTITSLYEDYYGCGIANAFCFEDQDDYELVPNKFDITTLVPFESRVLVRQNNSGIWGIDFFGFYNEGYYRTTGNCIYLQCVPYEQNEHLLGKTDDCDEYYKTWE